MGEYPQESKVRLVQICLQQKGHGKQSPSARWLRGTAVLMNFRLRPVYIFWHLVPQWHLVGVIYLFIFKNLLCSTSLGNFARFSQVSLKGLLVRPRITSKWPKLAVSFEEGTNALGTNLSAQCFGGTLEALSSGPLAFQLNSGGAVLCLSFSFSTAPQQEQRSVIPQSSHCISGGTGSLTFIYQRKAFTFSLLKLLQESLLLNSLVTPLNVFSNTYLYFSFCNSCTELEHTGILRMRHRPRNANSQTSTKKHQWQTQTGLSYRLM